MSADMVALEKLKAELQLDIERLDELRRFRHVFRNMYANDLDPKRVAAVQDTVPETLTLFRAAHDRFTADLTTMIAASDAETLNDT